MSRKGNSAPPRNGLYFTVAVITILAFVCENTLLFPMSVKWMAQLAHGLPVLDMRFGYTSPQVSLYFSQLGVEGRHWYLMMLWTVDLILPALFGTFLSMSIQRGTLGRLRLVPYLAAGLDYLENILITALLFSFSPESSSVGNFVMLASVITMAKQVAYAISAFIAVAGRTRARKAVTAT